MVPIIGRRGAVEMGPLPKTQRPPQNPLRLLTYPDILILLSINAIICAVFYGVIASISTLFTRTYPFLNETKIGLCFLAIGVGMIVGSSVTGRVLDWEYQTIKTQVLQERRTDLETRDNPADVTKDENFPIEKVRGNLSSHPQSSNLLLKRHAYGFFLL